MDGLYTQLSLKLDEVKEIINKNIENSQWLN